MPRKAAQRRFTVGGLMDMLGRGIEELTGAPDGMPGRIWAELSPWIAGFTTSASAKWLPFLTAGHNCTLPGLGPLGLSTPRPCTNHAIGPCAACGRPVCIHHAMVDQHGGICCYGCVGDIMAMKRGRIPGPAPASTDDRQPPVPPDIAEVRVARALETLGMQPGATWEAIRKRHRTLLAENHPDRKRDPGEKARAEARYKAVGAAYMDLERFYKKAAA